MSDDAFRHDDERFKSAEQPGGLGVTDAEARYADLFAEVVWDGVITPEKRQRLNTAAQTFGLSSERAQQIEQSLSAAQRMQVVEKREPSTESIDDEHSIEPLVDANDPRILALQKRIHHVEGECATLLKENVRLHGLNEGLEELVNQLQRALESTLDELDDVQRELARKSVATPPPPAVHIEPPQPPEVVEPPPVSIPAAPPSPPFRKAPSAPGSHPVAMPVDWETESDPGVPPERLTTRGFADPTPEEPRRISSRRVLASSARSAPMVALRSQRENPAEIHKLLRERPRDVDLLHQLYRSLGRADDLDRRWCTAHALVYLGAADDAERETFLDHTAAGLVRPTRAVNDDEWRELLFHPDEEALTGEILSCIAPAVVLAQMTTLHKNEKPSLHASQRVEPKTSTLQAVRCLEWAAAFLALQVPPIYACPDHDGTADIVLNPTPSTRLGKHALVGRSSKELAFLAGRHLCWYKKEHLLGKPTRSVRRLEDTFLAALMIGNPGLPIASDIKQRVEPIVQVIRPLIDGDTVSKLQHCFSRFVEHGGRTSLSRWYRGAERTSACTGLLLANDLHVAETMLRLDASEPIEEAMGELVVFFTAGRCSILRKRIGIAIS